MVGCCREITSPKITEHFPRQAGIEVKLRIVQPHGSSFDSRGIRLQEANRNRNLKNLVRDLAARRPLTAGASLPRLPYSYESARLGQLSSWLARQSQPHVPLLGVLLSHQQRDVRGACTLDPSCTLPLEPSPFCWPYSNQECLQATSSRQAPSLLAAAARAADPTACSRSRTCGRFIAAASA